MAAGPFSARVLAWYERHGRKDLPWQREPTPYRVWVSEIMLQQTQVATVVPYYERFMACFPTVVALAGATEDQVLRHWSGLGYYARARNLLRAAREIRDRHAGEFPESLAQLQALPGIGRSTAGAILALARGEPHPILDGNVKRLLARHRMIDGWPGERAVAERLWALAGALMPSHNVAAYTQAMMDLGAMVCTRSHPDCTRCPVSAECLARAEGRVRDYPGARPRKARPERETAMLMVCSADGVLLERRPPTGVWGGLWGFPEIQDADQCEAWCLRELGAGPRRVIAWAPLRHSFTHFHLRITPLQVLADVPADCVMEGERRVWYNMTTPPGGLAAPVSRLIRRLQRVSGPVL
jgi:A/G-specific adenine glycosylase